MNLRVAAGWSPALFFEQPARVWSPTSFDEALQALDEADDALNDGMWIAGALSYEFGVLLQGITEKRSGTPLLLLGAFESPVRRTLRSAAPATMSPPLSRVPLERYVEALVYLKRRIDDGEVYQVNYTVPFDAQTSGDPLDLFVYLAIRSRAQYAAFVESGDMALVSLSPELFLRFDAGRIYTKPMKGTADPDRLADLATEKNRAEHVMIVDLLRNDLHRICRDVRVERLFEVERYPTFSTMTSTICGDVPEGTTLCAVLRATFPCGSVTGAPKRAAMQHIAALEAWPRGFYTGSIGYLSPERRGWWNVAIRTLQICGSTARFDAGGGIVTDSRAADEWQEIGVKSRFLQPAHTGFALLETFRAGPGGSDFAAHVERLLRSAAAFSIPLDRDSLMAQLQELRHIDRAVLVRVRADARETSVRIEEFDEPPVPVRPCLSGARVRSGDPMLAHKTTWRPTHAAATEESQQNGCFDAILRNERDEITEGARTNIFAQIGNTLYTPPLESGVLPGILRSSLVAGGKAVERVLYAKDLESAQAIFAGNSARGLLPASLQR